MFEKMTESIAKDFAGKWKLWPMGLWLFLAIVSILAYDPLSPVQTDAQKLWLSIASYSPLMVKYGRVVVVASFLFCLALLPVSYLIWVKAGRKTLSQVLLGIWLIVFQLFTYAGSVCVAFLVLPNPSEFWNFNSLTDDLVKFSALVNVVWLVCANFPRYMEQALKYQTTH